jgi:protein SCO1/2
MPKSTICSQRCESPRHPTRRRALAFIGTGLATATLAGCGNGKWHSIDVSGSLPSLDFAMTRAADGKAITEADYRGRVVLLYFGYTNCPDICPTTLSNVGEILTRLGPAAKHVAMLFVTVDPNRDTPAVLAQYVKNFAPEMEGLRGTPDQLAALARRYHVAYSVTPAQGAKPYEVTHSPAIYVFGATGAARLIIASLASSKPDIAGTADDLRRLVDEAHPPGLLTRLERMV